MSFDPVIERQIERQMKSDWWNRFMLSGYAYHHEPHQWREALGVRGLYALSTGMKIVYVGKANCIGTRIKTHRRDQWMPFQAWSYQDLSDLSQSELNQFEADVIKELDPIFNLRCTSYVIRRLAIVGKLHLRSIGKLYPMEPVANHLPCDTD